MGFLASFFGPPSRERFAEMVAETLRAHGTRGSIALDPATFSLRITGGEGDDSGRVVALGTFYPGFARVERTEQQAFVDSIVIRHLLAPPPLPKTFNDARQRLLPALRSRAEFAFRNLTAEAQGVAEASSQPFALFGERIGIGLVLDSPGSMRVVRPADLEAWGARAAEAVQIATGNLRARTDPSFVAAGEGVWVSSWEDGHDATRLLLPDVVAGLAVHGRPVVVIPHRDRMIVTGEDDAAGLQRAAAITGGALDEPRAISAIPMVLEGTEWVELSLPDSHPATPAFQLAALRAITAEYDEQKELLDAVGESRNDEALVAPFHGTRDRATGAWTSYTKWSEGLPHLLPQAARVALLADDRVLGFVPWDDVVRFLGPSMVRTDDYPARFRVERFPDEAELRAMGIRRG